MGFCFYCASVSDSVICTNCSWCTVNGCDQKFKHGVYLGSVKGTEPRRYCQYHGASITREGGYCFTCTEEGGEEAGHLGASQVRPYEIYNGTYMTSVWGCALHAPKHEECKNCDEWFQGTCCCHCLYCDGTNTKEHEVKCMKGDKNLETLMSDKFVCEKCVDSYKCESCQTVCVKKALVKFQRKRVCVDCLECKVHGKRVVAKKFKEVKIYGRDYWGGSRNIQVPVVESGFKCKSCDYEKDTYGRPLINFHTKWAKEQEWRESGKFPYRIRKLDEYLEFAGERRKDSKTSMEFAQQHQAKRQRV